MAAAEEKLREAASLLGASESCGVSLYLTRRSMMLMMLISLIRCV
jgi:hypothetical protein